MQANAGSKVVMLEADVAGIGTAYYDPTQVANIFGFAHMADKYRVTYDSSVEDAFLVHTNDGIIKFDRTPEGLYVLKPTAKFLNHVAATKQTKMRAIQDGGPDSKVCNMVSTVEENKSMFTPRQCERAIEAR